MYSISMYFSTNIRTSDRYIQLSVVVYAQVRSAAIHQFNSKYTGKSNVDSPPPSPFATTGRAITTDCSTLHSEAHFNNITRKMYTLKKPLLMTLISK